MIFVEGESDRRALVALGARCDIAVLGGFGGVGRFLTEHPGGEVAGLCDAREAEYVARRMDAAGVARDRLFVCRLDLEDELIRALGVDQAERVLAEMGELAAFRTFQRQPAQRGRERAAQLRRFLGTKSGRKVAGVGALAAALAPGMAPAPLVGVLGVTSRGRRAG